jgi:hydantoinase/carbamoylase family amidase
LGIVKGIVGISRAKIEVTGMNDHAGTTPMSARKDALIAGSEVVLAVERICKGREGLVGTVGRIEVFPNSLNVIPGKAVLGMDLRSPNTDLIDSIFSLLEKDLAEISERRGVRVRMEREIVSRPVMFEEWIVSQIRGACHRLRIPYQEMISGAGHDAMHIAQIARAGMLFVPSERGRSHCPEEWTEFEHISQATAVLASTIAEIDQEGEI